MRGGVGMAGGQALESIVSIEISVMTLFLNPSATLDANDRILVAYYDQSTGDLRLFTGSI
jgi:hypothetical protein